MTIRPSIGLIIVIISQPRRDFLLHYLREHTTGPVSRSQPLKSMLENNHRGLNRSVNSILTQMQQYMPRCWRSNNESALRTLKWSLAIVRTRLVRAKRRSNSESSLYNGAQPASTRLIHTAQRSTDRRRRFAGSCSANACAITAINSVPA